MVYLFVELEAFYDVYVFICERMYLFVQLESFYA